MSAPIVAVPKIGPDIGRFVAARQQTEWATFTRDQEIPHPSKILEEHSEPGQRLGELYDVMLRTDAMLAGLWEKRWKAVLGLPWDLIPGDESDLAQEIRDQAMRMLDRIPGLDVSLQHQLEGIPKGVAFEELRYSRWREGRLAGLWAPVEVVDRPMWRFGFKEREDRDVLHVRSRKLELEAVEPARFLYFRHGTKDNPWGAPLLDRVYWFYYLTLHAWKYFGVALEKWAAPTPVGKYPWNEDERLNEEASERLLAAIYDMQTEYGIAIPKELEIELIEAQRAGSVSYEAFITLLDRAKALVLLGEVDTSGLAKGPGSFAKNRVSNEVRLETIRMDARALGDHLTDQLLAPFVALNWSRTAPVPYWQWDTEEAEPRKERQEAAGKVLDRGLEVPRSYFYRVHQVPQPQPGEETVFGDRTTTPPAAAGEDSVAWDEQELVT